MKTNRREFLKTISRNLLLAGLAGMSGYLVFKESREEAESCKLDFACKNCGHRQKCKLPEADSFRKNENLNSQK